VTPLEVALTRSADQSSANGGSSLDAPTAATLHQQWVKNLGGSYLIGSPAVARGGNTWLNVSVSLMLKLTV